MFVMMVCFSSGFLVEDADTRAIRIIPLVQARSVHFGNSSADDMYRGYYGECNVASDGQ